MTILVMIWSITVLVYVVVAVQTIVGMNVGV